MKVLMLLLLSGICLYAQEQVSAVPEVRRDVEWLTSVPSRVMGTPGHDRIVSRIRDTLSAFPGIDVWPHTFPVFVPVNEQTTLSVENGVPEQVYPVWPAGVQLCTTPEDGISGRLVYVHNGEYSDIPVMDIRGQIAVMETAGSTNWHTMFELGARAVILLGSRSTTFADIRSHILPAPVEFPRFYVPEGKLADRLRSGDRINGCIVCTQAWRQVTATNLYALARPKQTGKASRALCMAVPMDSMSFVPDLAPGADGAVDIATALALVRRVQKNPPPHPVLFCFIDAYAINQLGMREMFMAFGALPELYEKLQEKDMDLIDTFREHKELVQELEAADPLEKIHDPHFQKLHGYIKHEVQRDVLYLERKLQPLRLKIFGADKAEKEQLIEQIGKLSERKAQIYNAENFLLKGPEESEETDEKGAGRKERAKNLWQRARKRIHGQLANIENMLKIDAERQSFRARLIQELGFNQTDKEDFSPLAFVLSIDISDGGVAVGPSLWDTYLNFNETTNARDLIRWLQVLSGNTERVWPKKLQHCVNLAPLKATESADSHIVECIPNPTSAAASFAVPAMTWATLDSLRPRLDTPCDTADRLDWQRLGPQIDATVRMADAWFHDMEFLSLTKSKVPHVLRIQGNIVDHGVGAPVARVPMEGYMCALLPGHTDYGYVSAVNQAAGVRHSEFVRTGIDGRCTFDCIPCESGNTSRRLALHSYLLDSRSTIVRTINRANASKDVVLNADRGWRKAQPLRAIVFSCEQHTVSGLFDPRFLMPLPKANILDKQRGNPKRINDILYEGIITFFLEPGVKWQILLRAGIIGNRMILVNCKKREQAFKQGLSIRESLKGFANPQELDTHPFYTAAKDFYNLDARRLHDYKAAGLANKAIEKMQADTSEELTQAAEALKANDCSKFFRNAMGALATEIRAYSAIRATADDVVRGAIFLLLVLLPFAYATERLFLTSPHVYRQIGGVVAIFAVMTMVLWSFHPAFRMSTMPMIIIIAFSIIFMAILVIMVIFFKFESELTRMRSGRAESSSAKTSRFGLVTTAFRLGIANMRKRKFRTVLTSITILLITFALLCFMSASTYVDKAEYSLPAKPSGTGLLIRQPGARELPPQALTFMQSLAGKGYSIIPRYWWCNSQEAQWRIHVRNPVSGVQVTLYAGLGLSPEEPRITGIDRICPNWDRFARGDGCYISTETAEDLGVKPGDTVVVAGHSLVLAGTYNSIKLDTDIRMLDGRTLMPPDYGAMDEEERQAKSDRDIQTLLMEISSSGMGGDKSEAPPLTGERVIILPADLLKNMQNGSLRSMAIPTEDGNEARSLALDLSDKLGFQIYYSTEDQVRVMAAVPLSPKAPKSLFIPVLIMGLIIFNTMLSSLAERKNEIYIYTSLGLAPLHVGVLFLAEAITYGLLGSVFGYVIGQGVASLFGAMGWLGDVSLNFGGTQAVVTMLLVLLIVIVSSLVPAYLAGRMASPSEEMRWEVPAFEVKDGIHRISDQLPFTATSKTVPGLGRYLFEYFEAHLDGTIGHFTANDLTAAYTEKDGCSCLHINGTIWLAPYDLGVRQKAEILVTQLPIEEDLYDINVVLLHETGKVRDWHRLNRTFLGGLRRQLLGWRKLTPASVRGFIEHGKKMLQK